MRHLKRTAKLGRQFEHRNAMLANLVGSLIKHGRVTTTLAKAKAARSVAEKMVTLGKAGTLHARRLAAARLRQQPRSHFKGTPSKKGAVVRSAWRKNDDVVHILFEEVAPTLKARAGGYTRIIRMHQRQGDAAQLAILEWVELPAQAEPEPAKTDATSTGETKPAEPQGAKVAGAGA
ncbi:MAG: large subunit ribosomal protein [Verrucomicrobiota bacterium]|jgi:large subunit ribosomal protein L17